MKNFLSAVLTLPLLFLSPLSVQAQVQGQQLVGQWQCSDGSRWVNNPQGGSHYMEFVIVIGGNGSFQAQGVEHSGPYHFQAQGNWQLQQFADGLWFVAEGQSSFPLGVIPFKFMSVPRNANQMSYSHQAQNGLAVASACSRSG